VFQDGCTTRLPSSSSERRSKDRGALTPRTPRLQDSPTKEKLIQPQQPNLTSPRHIQPASRQALARGHPTLPCLPPQQFQALFDSLFKVLFIFPSRYLFAIGLPSIFSLRWDLPPTLGCIPKQPDSAKPPRGEPETAPTGFSPSSTSPSRELGHSSTQRTILQTTIQQPKAADFHTGLIPVHSPLLGESLLVSCPLLNDMLKFSR
jgi:hypothetical protein